MHTFVCDAVAQEDSCMGIHQAVKGNRDEAGDACLPAHLPLLLVPDDSRHLWVHFIQGAIKLKQLGGFCSSAE